MAKESSSSSRGSPATAGGSPAEISNSASQLAADTTVDVARSVQFKDDDARGQGYDDEDEDDEEKEEVDVDTLSRQLSYSAKSRNCRFK
ncbi:unnamed protein product [Phytophthora fragariaefolia]|uniref:Unnamed protein product n=1 Tax=Phytophthora fragariaefolia TaxID=1490495 RepID=A0A9W6X6H1_9STRA|nr:unnamed protein product [Phytophthora fragariaefolia]